MNVIVSGSDYGLSNENSNSYESDKGKILKISMFLHFSKKNELIRVFNTLNLFTAEGSESELGFVFEKRIKYNPSNRIMRRLYEESCLVDEDTDEYLNFCRHIKCSAPVRSMIRRYCIYLSSGCGKACQSRNKCQKGEVMSEATAEKLANYIIGNCNSSKITLDFYINKATSRNDAIFTLCKNLSEYGIDFESKLHTNCVDFDEQFINKAIILCNIKKFYLSINPGTDRVYNINLINSASNIINIFTEKKVCANLTIGFTNDSFNECVRIMPTLADSLIHTDLIKIDTEAAYIQDDENYKVSDRTMYKTLKNDLDALIYGYGLSKRQCFSLDAVKYDCTASEPYTLVVGANGDLSGCMHICSSNTFANLYTGFTDKAMFERHIQGISDLKSEQCKTCTYLPICGKNKRLCVITCSENNCEHHMYDEINTLLWKSKLYLPNYY